jgi:hypothetical protein
MIKDTIRKILREERSLDDKLKFFKRHMTDLENHLNDIVMEGFDYFNPCDYESKEKYIKDMVFNNAITLINSYEDLCTGDTNLLEKYIEKFVYDKYKHLFNNEWDERACDDEDDDNSFDEFTNMINNL